MRLHKYAVLLPLFLLGACATAVPPHAYLPDAARDRISSTDVVLPIRQSEIYVFVPITTGGAGFGLLGALVDISVDSVRTTKAEKAVKPLRDSMVDYSFDDTLQTDLKNALTQLTWAHPGDPRVVKEVTNDNMDRVLASSKADAVLFATTDYQLSNDCDILTITVLTGLYPNNDALRSLRKGKKGKFPTALENSLYRNVLIFKARVPGATGDRDHNIAILDADKGEAARTLLKMGTAKLAAMLVDDIQRHENAANATGGTAEIEGTVRIDGVEGQIIGTDEDGEIVRFADGTLKYVTKSAL